jgi:hypothetical protein
MKQPTGKFTSVGIAASSFADKKLGVDINDTYCATFELVCT